MPEFIVPENEWAVAHQYLDNAPDGTKLPFSMTFEGNQKEVRHRFENEPKSYDMTYSFMKINRKIYAFEHGRFRSESIDKAKYAQNEDGEIFIVKVGQDDADNIAEAAILEDLSLLVGFVKRIDKPKNYILIKQLGKNLKQHFDSLNNTLDHAKRMDMAIQLCWKVYQLHEGHASKTGTSYGHLDLKPDNVTIDKNNQIHLIDFGLSRKDALRAGVAKTKALPYLPYRKMNQVLTKAQYDVLALKRIFFMPDSFYGGSGHIQLNRKFDKFIWILTSQELKNGKLNDYINTHALSTDECPDYSQDQATAIMLCAQLINVEYQLEFDDKAISDNPRVALAITGAYFSGNIDIIADIKSDYHLLTLVAALNKTEALEKLHEYRIDSHLNSVMKQVTSDEISYALIYLKKYNMVDQYHTAISSTAIAQAIVEIGKKRLGHKLRDFFNNRYQSISPAIIFLKNHELESHYELVIDHDDLAEAICNIRDDKSMLVVSAIISMNEFNPDEMISISRNEQLIKAIHYLLPIINKSTVVKICKDAIANPDYIETLVNAELLNLNLYEIENVTSSLFRRQAINILVKAGFKGKKELANVVYDALVPKLIIKLDQFKLQGLFKRALSSFDFSYEALHILESDFGQDVTVKMLEDEDARIQLKVMRYSPQHFKGFKILFEAGLFQSGSAYSLADFKAAVLLKEKGLQDYFKILCKPSVSTRLCSLLTEEIKSDSGYALAEILESCSREDRYQMILGLMSVNQLKMLHHHKFGWKAIKNTLSIAERQKIKELIFSAEEIEAKDTLRSIKNEIKTRSWSYGLFDTMNGTSLGRTGVTVPTSVLNHVNFIKSVSSRQMEPFEAIAEIKRNGQSVANSNNNFFAKLKHKAVGKSETEVYFDYFVSEANFERKFVKK